MALHHVLWKTSWALQVTVPAASTVGTGIVGLASAFALEFPPAEIIGWNRLSPERAETMVPVVYFRVVSLTHSENR